MDQVEDKRVKQAMKEMKRSLVVLLDQAPSDSVAEIYIHSASGRFRSLIEVFSSQGRFVSANEGDKLEDVLSEGLNDLDRQLRLWRARRFEQTWLT